MASRSLQSLFLRAVDSRRLGGRWSLAVVIVLLAAHLVLLGPELGPAGEEPAPAVPAEALPTAVAAASEIEGELASLPRTIADGTDEIRGDLVEALRADLGQLEATVRALRESPGLRPDAGEDAAEDLRQPPPPDDGPTVAERARRDIGSMDRILAVRDAEPGEALRAALEPVVEDRITLPRFEEFARRWEEDVAATVRSSLDAAASGISRLRGLAPEQRTTWDELTAASRQLLDRTLDGAPRAPEDPRWWQGETEDEQEVALDPGAEDLDALLRREAPPLVEAAEGLHRRARAARDELELELATLAAGETEDAPDTSSAPPAGLPAALGVVLAALLAARNRADRELVFSAALFVESGGPVAVRDWTLARARVAPPRRSPRTRPRTGGWWMQGLVLGAAATVWIGVATLRIVGPSGLSAEAPAVRAGALGVLLVVLALAHRAVLLGPVLERLRRCAEGDEPEPASAAGPEEAPADDASSDPDEETDLDEPEDLDGHPLRP